jgi:hypothetical protein
MERSHTTVSGALCARGLLRSTALCVHLARNDSNTHQGICACTAILQNLNVRIQ